VLPAHGRRGEGRTSATKPPLVRDSPPTIEIGSQNVGPAYAKYEIHQYDGIVPAAPTARDGPASYRHRKLSESYQLDTANSVKAINPDPIPHS